MTWTAGISRIIIRLSGLLHPVYEEILNDVKQGASLSQVMMECEKRLLKAVFHQMGKTRGKVTPRTLFNKIRIYNL